LRVGEIRRRAVKCHPHKDGGREIGEMRILKWIDWVGYYVRGPRIEPQYTVNKDDILLI